MEYSPPQPPQILHPQLSLRGWAAVVPRHWPRSTGVVRRGAPAQSDYSHPRPCLSSSRSGAMAGQPRCSAPGCSGWAFERTLCRQHAKTAKEDPNAGAMAALWTRYATAPAIKENVLCVALSGNPAHTALREGEKVSRTMWALCGRGRGQGVMGQWAALLSRACFWHASPSKPAPPSASEVHRSRLTSRIAHRIAG